MTTLTAIIPTVATDLDRLALLRRSVCSALHQCRDGDEIIVAGDITSDPLDHAREMCQRLGADAPGGVAVRFVPFAGARHDYGHSQINHALGVARGEWLTFQDDDDVYCAGAFDALREEIARLPRPAPLLFRFRSHFGMTFWHTAGRVAQGHIGGHCLVTPNLPSLLGRWGERYEGDYDFIRETLDRWARVGVEPVWVDRLIAIARPHEGAR